MSTIPQDAPLRQCHICYVWKPATPNYFHRCASKELGLHYSCKPCRSKNIKRYDVALPDGYRQCYRCRKMLQFTSEYFVKNKGMKGGLGTLCKECLPFANRHYRQLRSSESRSLYQKQYVQCHREQVRKRDNAHAAKHREQHREYSRRHYHMYPEGYRLRCALRRARKKGAQGCYTLEDVQAQYKRQKGKCYYCHTSLENTYEVDHIVPLTRGGTNCPENLVVACISCNRSKHDKLPHEWPQGNRLL